MYYNEERKAGNTFWLDFGLKFLRLNALLVISEVLRDLRAFVVLDSPASLLCLKLLPPSTFFMRYISVLETSASCTTPSPPPSHPASTPSHPSSQTPPSSAP